MPWTTLDSILKRGIANSNITNVLKNTDAAEKLVNDVEDAIQERLEYPLAFEPFPSKKRDYPYYRIYIRNYVIYYVVIGDVMEVRRFLYGARDTNRYL